MSQHVLDSETMAVFCRLLNLYDGVTIDNVRSHPSGSASVMLQIAETTTVARLAYHASDACMEFIIWPVGHNGPRPEGVEAYPGYSGCKDWDEAKWASRIRYNLRATPSTSEESGLSVVTFCVCMVEELASLKRLAREEANQLRRGWGF